MNCIHFPSVILQCAGAKQPVILGLAEAMIRENNPQPILDFFADRRVHCPRILRQLHGRVRFRFAGFESVQEPFYSVPELRAFLQHWHRTCPGWFFFADLSEQVPLGMTLSFLPTLQLFTHDDQPHDHVTFHAREMVRFLATELWAVEQLCRRAGFDEERTDRRCGEIWNYFIPTTALPIQ